MVEIHDSVCPLDCPGACALKVTLNNGRLQSIHGHPDHPCTQGIICGKVSRYQAIQHGPRITEPMIRTGPKGTGTFEAVSWDVALDQIAIKLKEIMSGLGAEAILPFTYGGTMGVLQRRAYARLAARAGFSGLDGNICFFFLLSGWNAGVGKAIGPDPSELVESDLPILWGINAAATHISLMGFVKQARHKGGQLVVVDPYRNHTARLADLHIAP
ncbi:MAG: molybdopterin-dependent oxidoreductase, partial [Magnetococcales bacterium]|nr:molybdopterin-dependent oxidoreductase [Magnetococcales bacterium]